MPSSQGVVCPQQTHARAHCSVSICTYMPHVMWTPLPTQSHHPSPPNLHPRAVQVKYVGTLKAALLTTSGQEVPIYQYNTPAGNVIVHTIKQVGAEGPGQGPGPGPGHIRPWPWPRAGQRLPASRASVVAGKLGVFPFNCCCPAACAQPGSPGGPQLAPASPTSTTLPPRQSADSGARHWCPRAYCPVRRSAHPWLRSPPHPLLNKCTESL